MSPEQVHRGVRVQLPLTLNHLSEPEPDFAIVPLQTWTRHPDRADLVIEVADSSLSFDRNQKASVYAKAGIVEYWILNLKVGRLEVRRDPAASSDAPYGWEYATLHLLAPGQKISPLLAPDTSFEVSQVSGHPKSEHRGHLEPQIVETLSRTKSP